MKLNRNSPDMSQLSIRKELQKGHAGVLNPRSPHCFLQKVPHDASFSQSIRLISRQNCFHLERGADNNYSLHCHRFAISINQRDDKSLLKVTGGRRNLIMIAVELNATPLSPQSGMIYDLRISEGSGDCFIAIAF